MEKMGHWAAKKQKKIRKSNKKWSPTCAFNFVGKRKIQRQYTVRFERAEISDGRAKAGEK
jgi:hypothetical protein